VSRGAEQYLARALGQNARTGHPQFGKEKELKKKPEGWGTRQHDCDRLRLTQVSVQKQDANLGHPPVHSTVVDKSS
jgi:hypothetical protein